MYRALERIGLLAEKAIKDPFLALFDAGPGSAVVAAAQQLPGIPPLPPVATVARPSDLFYARLMPALAEAGVSAMAPRREWPADVLRRVLMQLARSVV